jgi:hypothetical protein
MSSNRKGMQLYPKLESQNPMRAVSDSNHMVNVQARYAAGTKDILDKWFKHEPLPKSYYIVREGQLASQYL